MQKSLAIHLRPPHGSRERLLDVRAPHGDYGDASRAYPMFPAELLARSDARWASFESSLDSRGEAVALESRYAWAQLFGSGRCKLAAVRDAAGEPILAVGVAVCPSRALPGHEIWRIERLGLPSPVGAVLSAARTIVAAARRRNRVLRVEATVVTLDAERRRSLGAVLASVGFRRRPEPERTYGRTMIVDLSPPVGALLGALSSDTRRKLSPERRALAVRTIEDPAFGPRLQELLDETFLRTGGRPEPTNWPAVIALSRSHPEWSRIVGMFRAKGDHQEDLLAFAWGCHHGEYGHYHTGASTRTPDVKFALSYALLWDLILWSRHNRARWFDLGGISAGGNGDDPLAGISKMKRHLSKAETDAGEEWVLEPSRTRALAASIVSAVGRGFRSRSAPNRSTTATPDR